MATYITKIGETLIDVCYNTTGSLYAIDVIMDLNSITQYDYTFQSVLTISVPDEVYNSPAVAIANIRPFNSSSIPEPELEAQFESLKTKAEGPI